MQQGFLGVDISIMALAVGLLIVISVLHRSTARRSKLESELASLLQTMAALEAERDTLRKQLEQTTHKLHDALVQMDRIDRRVRLYEAGAMSMRQEGGESGAEKAGGPGATPPPNTSEPI